MSVLTTKTMKSRYVATYPIGKNIFLKERFDKLLDIQNTKLLPRNVKVIKFKGDTKQYTFEEGLAYLSTHLGEEIGLYEFSITLENVIIEKFYIRNEFVYLETPLENEDEIQGFYSLIFPVFGVLLFGEFDMDEEFLVRDDVCSALLHKVMKKYTILTGTWCDDDPNVNHYFIYSEYEEENDEIADVMALGGEPLERCVEKQEVTAATFFLGKYINRQGTAAAIIDTDDMRTVQVFETDFIEMLTEALKASNIKHRIDYVAS